MSQSEPLKKYISILDVLSSQNKAMRFTDLVKLSGLAKSTSHRLLSTMTQEGLIRYSEESQSYTVGLKVLKWAASSWRLDNIPQVADEEMRRLNKISDEHVSLLVLDQAEIVYTKIIESKAPLRFVSNSVGDRGGVHCTAGGKVMAAYLEKNEQKRLIKQLKFERYTGRTITSRAQFIEELKIIQTNGYSLNDREEYDQVHGIAAPIFDHSDRVCAAINLWCPVFRRNFKELKGWTEELVQSAGNISYALGARLKD